MSATEPKPAWQVTGQRPTVERGPQGTPIDAMIVSFTMADGTAHEITVPREQWGPSAVRDLIQEVADRHTAVANLHG